MKEVIKLTNIYKFIKNFKAIKNKDSDYIINDYRNLVDGLKVCVCIEPFIHDDLQIEKGIYLLREKSVGYVVYEITGLWVNNGHKGGLLTDRAVRKGIKGWNIPGGRKDCFKIISINHLNSFIYWRDE